MGSPFIMGLNALVTRPVAQYVRSFEVCGQYKELGADEQARVGRVADGGMMLNILVRTAIDRMPYLDTFRYAVILGPCTARLMIAAGISMSKCCPSFGRRLWQSSRSGR